MTPSPRDFLSGARSVGVVVDPDSGREVEAYAYPGAVLLVTNRAQPWPMIWWEGGDPKRLTGYHKDLTMRETYSTVVPLDEVLSGLSGLVAPCTMEEVMGKPSARAAVRLYNKARELAQTLTLTKEITAPWADLIDEELAKRGRWSWDLLLWVSRTDKSRLKERNHLPALDMFRSDS